MDKAQRADRQALFAGLQVAVVALVDIKHGSPFTAELRAAREVARQARGYLAMFYGTPELRSAVAAYDAVQRG